MHELQPQLNIENAAALPAFEELLDLALEACLSDPEAYTRNLEALESKDRQLQPDLSAQKLGVWGLRRMIERENGFIVPRRSESEASEETEEESTAVEALSLPFDPAIQRKIEAFGQSLLDEAFLCLGLEAEDKVEEFKLADTQKEQVKVCNWLIDRIAAIHNASLKKVDADAPEAEIEAPQDETLEDEVTERNNFYHPARLSPKFIGIYPEIDVDPTCLGYSILGAAFFEKAGSPYMHTGVIGTAVGEARVAQSYSVAKITKAAGKHGVVLADDLQQKFGTVLSDNDEQRRTHNGFHAAVVAQVRGRRWIQFDPNYNSNIMLTRQASSKVEEIYRTLEAVNRSARGIESGFMNYDGISPFQYCGLIDELASEVVTPEEGDKFLQSVSEETALSDIFERYFTPILQSHTYSGETVRQLTKSFAESTRKSFDEYTQGALHDCLTNYVFQDAADDDITGSIRRCKTDEAYRARRAEDLSMVPMLAVLAMQSDYCNAIVDNYIRHAHSLSEYGMPAYRVGAAALSDFAVYCSDELPASFWLTYWASPVSFAEHYQQAETAAQNELVSMVAADIDAAGLSYGVVYGIVDTVLEQGGSPDGHE